VVESVGDAEAWSRPSGETGSISIRFLQEGAESTEGGGIWER
jgi:hypothetical protein